MENGHLFADIVEAVDTQQIESAEVENGHLFVKGVNAMAKVDLGQVVGATGPQGPKGDAGTAATITIGTVTTGAAGSNASVTNAGTATAARFNFTIPRGNVGETGATGATGATGPKGDDGITPTFSIENGHLFADYDNPYSGS